MTTLDGIRCLYTGYLSEARLVEQERKPTDGLLGFGPKPADAPCHDRFAKDLESLLDAIMEEEPGPALVREVLTYIYRAPLENREPLSAYWMLLAVHGLTVGLIDKLDRADAEKLWKQYQKDYPRWDRLPAQEEVLSLLKMKRSSAAGSKPKRQDLYKNGGI